ncbi:hypothetical protein RRF57_004588 [Xylaria bambusicola]|uniref:Heterokaryon incompatibility domain-containing protein n=1 Tax=Xylaria bambusicola TaxID=326684 RepID=A0AAN7UGP8_9PEZI
MWLLNSCTREMKEFISHKQTPPYAILSHTWGDEEVSFREWQYEPMRDIREKGGFRKIDFCCKQAADDGLEWVWIDTCCIDKSSSAELSEAINSMFQWYKNAAVCYAFLYDVANDSEFDLADTRCVNRGWTLQELIAPREVIFYSKDWQVLGTRSKLSEHIAKVTRINEPFLTGRSLDKASIAQRMSWAAKRTTSREEDEAYCLLGIFNVNMPLIYGEGRKAFRRLQDTIVREYPKDHSIFAWGKIVKTPSNTISNTEQIWGRELIKHEPDEVFDEFYGLLADSPQDFEQSGEIVIAPTAAKYFYIRSKMPSVSSVIGRIAHVDLPQYEVGPHVAFHAEYPRIVRILYIRHIVLLCGVWKNTTFHYAALPIGESNNQTSRTGEIVLGDRFTHSEMPASQLAAQMTKFTIQPLILPPPRPGDMIIRRHSGKYPWSSWSLNSVRISFIDGVIRPLHSSLSGLLFCYTYGPNTNPMFSIALIRLSDLDHQHDEPNDGKGCAPLRFCLNPIKVSQLENPDNPPLTIVDKQNDPNAEGIRETFLPLTLKTNEQASSYCFYNWKSLKYSHDMAVPQDEWNISILGIADIYINVTRVCLNGYEGDDEDEEDEDLAHRFVDVLDIVVNENHETTEEADRTTTEDEESS